MKKSSFLRRRQLRRIAIILSMVAVVLGVTLLFGGAHVIGLRQQTYNVLFIALVLPACMMVASELLWKEHNPETR